MRRKLLSILALLCLTVSSAWATEVTIATNQQQTSYTSGDITISVSMVGDGDGAQVSSWCPMTITCGDGNVLQSVVVTIGFYPENASEVTASAGSCEVSGDDNKHSTYVTVTGINASSVSIGCNGDVQIEQVVVNYSPSAPAVKETIGGIVYTLNTSDYTAQVGYNWSYSGALTIPGTVEYESETYTVTSICGAAFDGCSSLTSVTIPNSVTSIGGRAFASCTSLTSVIIPESVTSIGDDAFYDCTGLTSVTIGSGVTSIDNGAFLDCSSLTSVTIYAANAPSSGACVFNGCDDNLKIYVFSDKVTDYQGATNWSDYNTKITAIPALTANSDGAGNYWATYYNELANVKMPSSTQVFKVALTGSTLEMTEITDRIVNAGQGVVLKSSLASIELAPAASGTTDEGGYSGNSLQGTMTQITTNGPNNYYVLNNKSAGIGFYKLSNTYEGTIGANKAYLTYSDGAGARESFLFGEATGIEMPTAEGSDADAVVYDLQGRPVAQPTKGLYIVNGKKVFINK